MKKTSRKNKMTSEKLLLIVLAMIILAMPLSKVYTIAILSETNIELEKMKNNINEQENINASLNMQISELASLDIIQDVASQNGLTYENGNITVVAND